MMNIMWNILYNMCFKLIILCLIIHGANLDDSVTRIILYAIALILVDKYADWKHNKSK